MKEIRRRTRVVGSFPDGYSAMMLVGARLRHISTTKWGTLQSCLQNLRNGCIIRNWHNFYNQSKRNVHKIPDTTLFQTWSNKKNSVIITPFTPAHTTESIGFTIGISTAENHQYPIHLPSILVIPFRDTLLKHRIPVLRSLRFNNDCFRSKEQR